MSTFGTVDATTAAIYLAAETLAELERKGLLSKTDTQSIIERPREGAAETIGDDKARELFGSLFARGSQST